MREALIKVVETRQHLVKVADEKRKAVDAYTDHITGGRVFANLYGFGKPIEVGSISLLLQSLLPLRSTLLQQRICLLVIETIQPLQLLEEGSRARLRQIRLQDLVDVELLRRIHLL